MEKSNNYKRKQENLVSSDDDSRVLKRYKIDELEEDRMIYALGTQIHFTAQINSHTIERLIKVFTKVIKENIPKFGVKLQKGEFIDIDYIVDSPGGSVTSVLKFVDFMKMVKHKHPYFRFNSIITGMVASAGTTMSVIADRRYMTENAFAMIHELSSGTGGKYTEMMSYAGFLSKMHVRLVDIYLEHNHLITKEKLELLLMKESWFGAEEYKQLGFVDYIKCVDNDEEECVEE